MPTSAPDMAAPRREAHDVDMADDPEEKSDAKTHARDRASTTEETLFERRTVLLFGEITTALAARVSSELLALAALSPAPIRLLVHSPGGHVEAGDTMFDVIRFIEPEVHVVGTGWVASAGALVFVATPRERRYCLPNTRFMLHQPRGGMQGPASDIEIEARQISQMHRRLIEIFSRATGRTEEEVARDTDRNHWMTAEEAKAYGLVHRIVSSVRDLPP